jgi:Tfp pilus assembly protein PilP
MRLATFSRILMPLAASVVLSTCAVAQEHVNVSPSAVRDQLNQSGAASQGSPSQTQQDASQAEVKTPKKPASPAAKAPAPAGAKPATPPVGPAAQAQATAPAKSSAAEPGKPSTAAPAKQKAAAPANALEKAADKGKQKPVEAGKESPNTAAATPSALSAEKAPEEKPAARRDPFDTLLTKARASNAPPENLPPGKAGLIVESLRIDGIVRSPMGMIAIVSNAQQRVYFLRDGDKLYDGSVDKIALNSISFHEIGKDAFGKPLERTVTKPLYASSGEQQ